MEKEQNNIEEPKSYMDLQFERFSKVEHLGIEAHKHHENCKHAIGSAVFFAIVGLLLAVILVAASLPLVNGQPIIDGLLVTALAFLSAVMILIAVIFALVAKKQHALTYDYLLKRERAMPKETPVLVRMV